MKTYIISAEAHALLAAHSPTGKFANKPRADGTYAVELDEQVAMRLDAIDPDVNKAIKLLCSTGVGNA